MKNTFNKALSSFLLVLMLGCLFSLVYQQNTSVVYGATQIAQGTNSGGQRGNTNSGGQSGGTIGLVNPLKGGHNDLKTFLLAIVSNIIIPIGGIIAALAIIYSGFLFVTAQGSEDQIKTAKRAFTYAAIGTAILLGSLVIVNILQNTINQLTK